MRRADVILSFQAFEAIEDALRTLDGEIDKTREKIKKDYENNLDAAEYVKASDVSDHT